jgi:eukaryotic-like serine/threonine-protein kinase
LGSHVSNLSEYVEIAEKKMSSSNGQVNPLDRHAAAFIMCKSKGLRKYLKTLSSNAPGTADNALAQIKIFAKLQASAYPKPLPGFCRWMEEMQKPILAKIRSRLRQEFVSKKFQEAKKTGSLGTILKLTDIERQLAVDSREYDNALATAEEAERIAAYLEGASQQRKVDAARYGTWITSVLAITSLVTSMIVSALYFVG